MAVALQETLDVELSDDQIFQMLRDAGQRLETSSNKSVKLATSLASQTQSSSTPQNRLSTGNDTTLASYIKTDKHGAHVSPTMLISSADRNLANGVRIVNDSISIKAKSLKKKQETAGSDWYNMPRTDLTPELKRDLQLLRMRSVLDPKRHYKKDNANKNGIPEYSQIGTIIEGPTEFFSGRLTNKERKRTLVEEVLEGERNSQRFKSKYRDIQKAKMSGKKEHYKALKTKRRSVSKR